MDIDVHGKGINEIKRKSFNSEKGSITVFVLAIMLFMIIILAISYMNINNKQIAQTEDSKKIQKEYEVNSDNPEKLDEAYDKVLDKLDLKTSIELYKTSGEKYSVDEWTNQDLSMKIFYSNTEDDTEKYFYLDGQKIKYEENYPITDNCVIRVQENGKTTEVKVTKIDKENPTYTLKDNGGTFVIPEESETGKIKTIVTAHDNKSGVKKIEYAWSQSNTVKPQDYETTENGKEIEKTECTQGDYYLWIKVTDYAGNETIGVSKVFTVLSGEEFDSLLSLTAVPSADIWTNQDVIVTAKYGVGLENNRILTCTGTENKDYVLNGTSSVIVKTNNQTVTVSAEDSSGNKLTKTLTVTNIDKTEPTVTMSPNGGTGYVMPSEGKATIKTTLTAKDEGGSGLNTLQYAWNTSNTTAPITGWTEFKNGDEIKKTDCTEGNYYLWTKVTDKAGNEASNVKVSNAFTVNSNTTEGSQITLTANKNTWTNTDVIVTVTYGVNLTQGKTLTCTGTQNTDYTINGTINVTVKTNNQTVTATATDIAGNKVTKTYQVTIIDKTLPTVTIGTNGGTYTITPGNTTANISTKLTAQDTGGSGLNTLQYQITTATTIPADNDTNWKNFTNGATITEAKTGGTYYLYTKVTDVAGNRATNIQKSNAFIVNYQVVYNANGGTGAPAAQTKIHGANLTLSSTIPTKSGYTFRGWATSSTATTASYQAGATYSNNAAITLYAVWSKSITATFNYYNGTTMVSKQVSQELYNSETQVTITSPTIANAVKDGITYTPRGWSTTNTGNANIQVNSGANVTLSANATYYALYSKTMTATFYYYNGTASTNTTGSATRYMNASGTYIENNITVPAAVTGSSGAASTTYSHVATSKTGSSVTPTTATTTYYAVYKKTVTATLKYYNNQTTTKTGTAYGYYDGTTANASIALGTTANATVNSVTYTPRGWSTANTANANITVALNGSASILNNTTYYASYSASIVATFYYYSGSAQTSTTASATRCMNYTGTLVEGTYTVPAAVTGSSGAASTTYSHIATTKTGVAATLNTTTTTYYAVYKKTVTATLKYYNNQTTTKTGTAYGYCDGTTTNASITLGTTASATVNSVTYTPRGWSTSNTANANITVALNGSASILNNTTYYASYSASVVATFYYYSGSAQTSTTASATRCMNYTGTLVEGTYTVPAAVTGSSGAASTTYSHIATTKTGAAATLNTTTTTYYAVYKKTVTATLKYYNNQTTTKTGTAYGYCDGTTANASINLGTTTLSGYTFRGWSTSNTGNATISVAANGNASILNNTTYYALYSNTVTATFHYWNGSAAATTTNSATRYMNATGNYVYSNIAIPTAVSGSSGAASTTYSHVATSKTGSSVTPTTATTTYYAVYKKTVTATLKYYNNQTTTKTGTAYGYYDGTTANATINLGTTTLSGYTFRGWSTSTTANASITVVSNGSVNLLNNATYYASYSYSVKTSYNVNGGSSTAPATTTSTAYMNYIGTKVGEAITLGATPTRTGYTFNGWYSAASGGTKRGNAGASYSPTASETLYAQWTAITYTVEYNGNGNTGGSTASSSHTYGVEKALTTNGFTKTGYTFQGWATTSTGEVTYTNAQSVSNLTTTNGAKVTLYAKWKANTYTVKYNGNGSTGGSTTSSTHTYGVAKALTTNGFTKTGYTFQGWATSSSGSVTYADGESVTNLSTTNGATVELYAVWVDKTVPAMGSLTASTTAWTNQNVTLTGKATDTGSGISYYQFSTNGNLTASSSGWISITNTKTETTQTYSASSNGTYYFYVKDAAGNMNKKSIVISNIDKIAPTLTITGYEYIYKKGDTSSQTYTVTLGNSITDTGGSGANKTTVYSAWSTSGTTQPSTWSTGSVGSNIELKVTTLQPINYYLWTKSFDNAGNQEIKATVYKFYEISLLSGPTKSKYLQSETEVNYDGIQLLKHNTTQGDTIINTSSCTLTSTDDTEWSSGIRYTIEVTYESISFTILTYKNGWYGEAWGDWYYWEDDNQYAVGKRTLTYNNIENDYYFNSDGIMHRGWLQEGSKWIYYLNIVTPYGRMDQSQISDEEWEALGLEHGAKAKNIWLYISENAPRGSTPIKPFYWYHFDSDGYMQTGWIQLEGKWYYLKPADFSGWSGPEGSMLYSTSATINGKTYNFNASGVCTNP